MRRALEVRPLALVQVARRLPLPPALCRDTPQHRREQVAVLPDGGDGDVDAQRACDAQQRLGAARRLLERHRRRAVRPARLEVRGRLPRHALRVDEQQSEDDADAEGAAHCAPRRAAGAAVQRPVSDVVVIPPPPVADGWRGRRWRAILEYGLLNDVGSAHLCRR